MTMYTISQLTAKLLRQEQRVTVQYKGKTCLVEVASAGLSDYAVTAVGHKKWGHSQPCMSVAACKEWIRDVHGADIEEDEAARKEAMREEAQERRAEAAIMQADLQAMQSTDAYVLHYADIKANVVIAFSGSDDMFALSVGDATSVLSEARQKFKLGHVTYKEAILLAALPFIKSYRADREHKRLKAEAHMCKYGFVIRGPVQDGEPLYWSNVWGWGSREGCTVFYNWRMDKLLEETGRDLVKYVSNDVISVFASTQPLSLPPGFRLQRTRKDAVHWHCEDGGVSRDFSTAAEAVEFAWLYWENMNN